MIKVTKMIKVIKKFTHSQTDNSTGEPKSAVATVSPPKLDSLGANNSTGNGQASKTKLGIASAKAKGVVWGKHGPVIAAKNNEDANQFAETLRPLIVSLLAHGGCRGATALARRLNADKVPTRNGAHWHPVTVRRLIHRLQPSLGEQVKKAKMSASKAFLSEHGIGLK
jgi:hypothetical protein